MGMVLGANIGTTISSQIIAMDLGKYSPVFLAIGLIMVMVSKTEMINKSGKAILFFGILFFGLYTMERSVEPLKEHPLFYNWIQQMNDPFKGTLTGAVVTLIIQSSSATVGMAIVLAKKGLLPLAAGIGVMMGAELGTVSDTLLATIKGNRQALKTGLFHLVFNLLSIITGLILFYPFLHFIEWLNPNGHIEHAIANAHMFFNIFGVICFVGFVPLFEKLLNKLLPEKVEVI